jgi:hypothetical protein
MVLAVLVACAPPADDGVVLEKDFEPAHTTTTLIPQYITICVGTPVVCRQQFTHMLPVTTNHDDAWRIRVDPNDGEPQWVEVTEAEYDAIDVGAFWERSP